MSGHKRNSKTLDEKKPLPHGWIVMPSKTYPDRVYFYNVVTRCSTWNNPCELIKGRRFKSSSPETSSPERKSSFKIKNKSAAKSYSKRCKSKTVLLIPDRNSNFKINSDIEDYDEQQDQYFDNISVNAFNSIHSNISSPGSPESIYSSKTVLSDSDKCTELNKLKNNKKHLRMHLISNFENPKEEKTPALGNFEKPSTSKNLSLETTCKSFKKSLLKDLPENNKQNGLETKTFNYGVKKSIKRRKKRKKIKESIKNGAEKIVKDVFFKKSDKTPAQTHLSEFRKRNTEKLKELVSKFPDFVSAIKSVDNQSVNKYANSSNSDKQTESDSFSDAYMKRIETCDNVIQGVEDDFRDELCEEMDWEPSNEESDVRNINALCQREKIIKISSNAFFDLNLDHSFTLFFETHSWFIVLDTNIFVSCLSFVIELRDTKVTDLGYPIIYVPWRVLQELDHLKDSKIDVINKHLTVNVRKAISYLNENFKSKHPRILGQSFENFTKMVGTETFAPDDEILQTCIQLKKLRGNNNVILLTNDKNLESKAIVSGLEVYSKDRFQKKYLNFNSNSLTSSGPSSTPCSKETKIDSCLCEVKAILKDILPLFVETEMKVAFGEDWVKIAFKKPPWTLQDTLECLLRHWRSVFFLNFSKETHSVAKELHERLFKRGTVNTENVRDIIKTSQRLILSIKSSQKKDAPYMDLIPDKLTKLSELLETFSKNNSSKANCELSNSLLSPVSSTSDFLLPNQQSSQDEVHKSAVSNVKNLFKDIWDSLRNFCCSVSDVIHSPCAGNDVAVQNIRLKVSEILNEVGELVITVEEILKINVSDIAEDNPSIIRFSMFLIRVYPAMSPDLKKELPKSLAVFFKDFEGRYLLNSSLKDFKEFIHDLSKATEYFNSHFAC